MYEANTFVLTVKSAQKPNRKALSFKQHLLKYKYENIAREQTTEEIISLTLIIKASLHILS